MGRGRRSRRSVEARTKSHDFLRERVRGQRAGGDDGESRSVFDLRDFFAANGDQRLALDRRRDLP